MKKSHPVKVHRFTASPYTTLQVEVVIHPSERCLNAFYSQSNKDGDQVRAYCESSTLTDHHPVTARLHFARDTISASLIAHEAHHATEAIKLHQRLTGTSDFVEEILAETVGNIVEQVEKFCLELKIKVASVTAA